MIESGRDQPFDGGEVQASPLDGAAEGMRTLAGEAVSGIVNLTDGGHGKSEVDTDSPGHTEPDQPRRPDGSWTPSLEQPSGARS